MNNKNIDIALLVLGFSRPKLFKAAVESLANLGLSKNTPVYAVIDGPRKLTGKEFILNKNVQLIAKQLKNNGLLKEFIIRKKNLGTKINVFKSVTEILKFHDYIFVLEDDLEILPIAKNSIYPMIKEMQKDKRVSAFSIYCNKSYSSKIFYSNRFSSQAWGTNKKNWSRFKIDELSSMDSKILNKKDINKKLGSDIFGDFLLFQKNKLDSWAVPWNIYNYLNSRLMIYTHASYIQNNSHLEGAERTKGIIYEYEKASTFVKQNEAYKPLINYKYIEHFSIKARFKRKIISKIKNLLFKVK